MCCLALAATGCYSGLHDPFESGAGASAGQGGFGEGDDDGADDDDEPGADPDRPDPAPLSHRSAIGLRRLTKFEYGNTLRDLLGVEGAGAGLPEEQKVAFLSNNAHVKRVGLAELEAFSMAAGTVATAALDTVVLPGGCSLDELSGDCVSTFADGLLLRAFRRPPTAQEHARYGDYFDARRAAGDPPREAFRLMLEAVLMSPHFLYRAELGTEGPDEPGALTGYERASRLSYLLWATMPDDALLDAARDGELDDPDGVELHAQRLLDDPRAQTGVVRFVSEWLGFDEARLVEKSPSVVGELPASLQADLEAETQQFVVDALLGPTHSLSTLMTSTRTFANATTATIYGLDGTFDSDPTPVELDPATRRGILTQPLVLAAHTKEAGYSVVQMGQFVRERLLCQEVPPPPPGFDTTIDESQVDDGTKTYRELLTELTSDAACVSCHGLINEPGFAFLGYDPVGRVLTHDPAGNALRTDGSLTNLDATTVPFSGAVEMIDAIADSEALAGCFARRYVEYAFGRTLHPDDYGLYHRVLDGLEDSDGDFVQLVSELVTSERFVHTGPFE